MKSLRLFTALMAALLTVPMTAGADDALTAKLKSRISAVIPDTEVTSVKPGPIPGLYEVMLGPTNLYMTGDGKFAVRGDVFDLDSKINVTDQRRTQARVEAFQGLGDNSAIQFAATGVKASAGMSGRKISPVPPARLELTPASAVHAFPTNG